MFFQICLFSILFDSKNQQKVTFPFVARLLRVNPKHVRFSIITVCLVDTGFDAIDRRHDIQHNDTQHNDTQHKDNEQNDTQRNDTQHNNTQHNNTQHNDTHHNDILQYWFIEDTQHKRHSA